MDSFGNVATGGDQHFVEALNNRITLKQTNKYDIVLNYNIFLPSVIFDAHCAVIILHAVIILVFFHVTGHQTTCFFRMQSISYDIQRMCKFMHAVLPDSANLD